MNIYQTGWDHAHAVPDGHEFNDYLSEYQGRLRLNGLDLMQVLGGGAGPEPENGLGSPLEIVYLPLIRRRIRDLQLAFERAAADTKYPRSFKYVYASKANAAEEVIRTVLNTGVDYEFSSWLDIEIARQMKSFGHLSDHQTLLCNGFKPAGSMYAEQILAFKGEHDRLLPIIEDLSELPVFERSTAHFDLGLRQKCYGSQASRAEMDALDVRFGLSIADVFAAAERIAAAPGLDLRLYHAMVGGQMTDIDEFMRRLETPIQIYAELREKHPGLDIFNFGGGLPAAMSLGFDFDYTEFARRLMIRLAQACQQRGVRPPRLMGEMGRYTVSEHGAHLFKVIAKKQNGSELPWYLIDGSIMSSFPDVWALSEHFIVLPLNHLDKPFRPVRLGGITCDSDDVYPPHGSRSVLMLPDTPDELYIGFFSVGAYQEMLGGAGGSKHCVIPEANELVVDCDQAGEFTFELLPGQDPSRVLKNLGYGRPRA
jgi:arginine decarboxylase